MEIREKSKNHRKSPEIQGKGLKSQKKDEKILDKSGI